jgi:hypothetical protein
MHFCKAKIAIGGDHDNVFYAGEFAPVSWPEILVLQQVHGESAIDEVEPFVSVNQTPRDERQRLVERYGDEIVDLVFGGKQGRPNEMEAPSVRIKAGVAWLNPLTREVETTSGKAPEPEETTTITTDSSAFTTRKR